MKKHLICIKTSILLFIFFFTVSNIALAEIKIPWFAELCKEKKSLIEVIIDCRKVPNNTIIEQAIFEVAFFDNKNSLLGKQLFSFLDKNKLSNLQSPDCYVRYFKHGFRFAYTAKGQFLQTRKRTFGTTYSYPPSPTNMPIRHSPQSNTISKTSKIKTIDVGDVANPQGKKLMVINSSVNEIPAQKGKPISINIKVKGLKRQPVIGAIVEVSAGNGQFLRTKSGSTVGYTNKDGNFIAYWHCVQCAPGQSFGIKVIKPGYIQSSLSEISGSPLEIPNPPKIGLRTLNGMYFVAERGGGEALNANRKQARQWETFLLIDVNGGQLISGDYIFLKTYDRKHYLSVANGNVNATATATGKTELFTIHRIKRKGEIKFGDQIALKSYRGKFVVAEQGGGNVVNANRSKMKSWEIFTLTRSSYQAMSVSGKWQDNKGTVYNFGQKGNKFWWRAPSVHLYGEGIIRGNSIITTLYNESNHQKTGVWNNGMLKEIDLMGTVWQIKWSDDLVFKR